MVLSAALPMLLIPARRRSPWSAWARGDHAFVPAARAVERVDTIEIEQGVVDAARLFGEPVGRVFADPRSRIHIEDAKTFFARHARRYDIIMSEPRIPG
jgi:hypothetical protein